MSKQEDNSRIATINQVIAWNLREARRLRRWTQAETARRLEPYLGTRWSTPNYSLAERSYMRPDRIRNFTGDELGAFVLCFRLPVLWFFLPPSNPPTDSPLRLAPAGAQEEKKLLVGPYLERILGAPEGPALLAARLEELFAREPGQMEAPFFKLLDEVASVASRSAVKKTVARLDQRVKALRSLALFLEESSNLTTATMEDALKRSLDDYYGELLTQKSKLQPSRARKRYEEINLAIPTRTGPVPHPPARP